VAPSAAPSQAPSSEAPTLSLEDTNLQNSDPDGSGGAGNGGNSEDDDSMFITILVASCGALALLLLAVAVVVVRRRRRGKRRADDEDIELEGSYPTAIGSRPTLGRVHRSNTDITSGNGGIELQVPQPMAQAPAPFKQVTNPLYRAKVGGKDPIPGVPSEFRAAAQRVQY